MAHFANFATVPARAVKAKRLVKGQWLHFPASYDMLIDEVMDTRDDKVLVRCGYRPGDDTATMFFEQEERVLVRNQI